MRGLRILIILLVGATCFPTYPVSNEEPHDSMVGADPRPGTEALHPYTDQMRVVECDDEQPQVWPSPEPLPTPKPIRLPASSSNTTLTNSTNTTKPSTTCEDDEQFEDSMLRKCSYYTMNKEECIAAGNYINGQGQTARHACCKCGGGNHVRPTISTQKSKCSHLLMGDDCEEEEMIVHQQGDSMNSPDLVFDVLPGGTGQSSKEDVAPEEDEQQETGTLTSMDSVLEPDSIVFRNRNFIGYPREPESAPEHGMFDGDANSYNQYTTKAYVVKPHETVDMIAQKFHIPASLLVSFNEDVADPLLLKAGDVLLIPEPRVVEVHSINPMQFPLEGGVDIVVSGRGFIFPAYCKFGSMVSRATYVVDGTIVCPSPGQTDPGAFEFAVSDGNGGFEKTNFTVQYTVGLIPFCDEMNARPSWCRPRIGIYSVSPLRIPQNTPTNITIFGTGFNSSTICRIGGDLVDTTVVSRTNITCHFQGKDPSVNSIVLNQGGYAATTALEIVVFSTLNVTDLEPKHGPDSTSTEVTLIGTTFRNGALCRFGEILVPATIINDTRLTCLAPPHEAGVVTVHVTNTGDLFSPTPVQFEYTHLHLFSLSEKTGTYKGGDILTLTGEGFYPGMFCRFGSDISLAEYLSRTQVRCRVPPKSTASVVRVQVSIDGIKGFSDEVHEFSYFAEITEIRPSKGQTIGGDDVHVFGASFDQFTSYSCRFGANSVPAVVVSTSEILCTSPPGTDVVEFSLDSQDFQYHKTERGETLTFTYVSATDGGVFHVSPTFTFVRVPTTSVRLVGIDFVQGMLCRFGDKSSESTFIDDKTILCTAPMRDLAETVDVSVSRDAGQSWSARLTQFEYRAVVESIEPPLGPLNGGNRVLVKGYGFNFRVNSCVFGNKLASAVVLNQFELSCAAPASETPAKVPFAVTSNSSVLQDTHLTFVFSQSDATSAGVFYLYSSNPEFAIRSIQPESGSIFGGDVVVVHGEGFDHTSHCMFGDRTVKSEFLDAATLQCITPPHPAGDVAFKVVNFDQANGYSTASLISSNYVFVAPTITAIDPKEGIVTGDELIRVTGTFLAGATTCKFGQLSTPVIAASAVEVTCKSPASEVATTVGFELGYKEGASETGTKFFYHPLVTQAAPKSGLILSSTQIVTFTGKGFAGPILCVFEDKEFVPATIRSNSEITCAVPTSSVPHSASLKLTDSDRKITLGKKSFDFLYQPKISVLFPTFGPTTGESSVIFVGVGLSDSTATHCDFDGQLVKAQIVSSLMARCVSPPHAPGQVKVALTAPNSNEKFASNSVDFLYRIMTTHVDALFPTFGSVSGGTEVTIRGSGFVPGAFCKFGDQETPATFVAEDHVTCTAPPAASGRTVAVEVSQGGNGDGFSADGRTFTYNPSVGSVDHIEPAFGEAGDTIDVFGEAFQRSSVCFVGGRRAAKTKFITSNHLTCDIPRIGSRLVEPIHVTSDFNFVLGGHVLFTYNAPPGDESSVAVREVTPNRGPITGGTNITVTGVNFPAAVLCQFGDTRVRAVFVSTNQVWCLSPPRPIAETVNLEIVSTNRRIFSSSLIRFSYEAGAGSSSPNNANGLVSAGTPVLTQITPTTGEAEDRITLTGTTFSSVGFCIFYQDAVTIPVQADVVDNTHVTCGVPERPDTMGPNVLVKYLSVGGAESQSLEFKYLE